MINRNLTTCIAALFVIMIPYLSNAQLTYNEHIIDTEFIEPYVTSAVDMDHDGDMDVLCGSISPDGVGTSWWEQTEPNVWTRHSIDMTFSQIRSIFAVDINHDGDIDVIATSFNEELGDNIIIHEQVGPNQWTTSAIGDTLNQPVSIFADDIDNDADIDIVVGLYEGDINNLSWFEQTAPGEWLEHRIAGNLNTMRTVVAHDIDQDGDKDLITATSTPQTILWWEQTGFNNWTVHTIDDNLPTACDIHIADIDGDGDPDVVGTGDDSDIINWYEMNGPDDWNLHLVSDSFNSAIDVVTGDLDMDGDLDIVATGYIAGNISWFEQIDIDTWARHNVGFGYGGANSISVADFDADGDIDILGLSQWTNVLTWWENIPHERPDPFSLISPEDLDTSWALDIELTWESTVDLDGVPAYDVWLGTTPDLSNAVQIADSIADTTCIAGDLFADIMYYWTVRATDDNTEGTWANDTLAFSSYMLNPPDPEPFNLFSPADGTVLWNLTVNLLWFPTNDPDTDIPHYDLWISDNPDMSDADLVADSIEAASYTVNLLNNHTYYWTVRATDRNTRGTWADEIFSFSVDLAMTPDPEPFSLISPENNEIVWFDDIDLDWEDTTDPDGTVPLFKVWLATRANLSNAILVADSIAESSFRVTGLNNHQTYYWTVYATDTNTPGTWAEDTLSFRVNTEAGPNPEAFALLTPADGDTVWDVNTTLTWEMTTDPDEVEPHYDVWIGNSPDMSDAVMIADSLAGTQFELNDLLDDTQYFWTVRATDNNTMGTWADQPYSFNTYLPEAPQSFELLEPENGYVIEGDDNFPLVFTWEGAIDPDPDDVLRYVLVLSTDSTFASDTTTYNANISELYVMYNLDINRYWWLVRVTDRFGFVSSSTESNLLDVTSYSPGIPTVEVPLEYSIVSSYPNPFNPTMNLVIGLPDAAELQVRIYNLLGQQVALITNELFTQGYHDFMIDGSNLSSGTYIIQASVEGKMDARQTIMLVK